jgi:hypothetical protein
MADLTLQNFVIARLADYCDFRQRWSEDMRRDPIGRLMRKLEETAKPIATLKQQLLDDTTDSFIDRLRAGDTDAAALADYKQFLDAYLKPGDFADAAFHLDLKNLKQAAQAKHASEFLPELKAYQLLGEQDAAPQQASKTYIRIVGEIYNRLDFPCIERLATRCELTTQRLRFLLRRCRFNAFEYSTVFRFPTHAGDGFTPFILPRVEGLIAANRQLLTALRGAA